MDLRRVADPEAARIERPDEIDPAPPGQDALDDFGRADTDWTDNAEAGHHDRDTIGLDDRRDPCRIGALRVRQGVVEHGPSSSPVAPASGCMRLHGWCLQGGIRYSGFT